MGGHAYQGLGAGHLGVAELADGGAIGLQRVSCLLQVGDVFFRQFGRQALEVLQGVVDRVEGWLFGFALTAVGVAANLEARLLDQFAQVDHAVERRYAVTLQHGFFHFGDAGHGIVGSGAEFAAGVFTLGAGLGHVVEGAAVFGDSGQLLIDHGRIGRLLDQAAGGLQAAFEFAQQIVDGAGTLFAATHFVILACNAQVLGQVVEAGDEPQLIAAAGHAAQAAPAGEGDQQGQQQHQTEADPQLAFDADVSQILG
ncbi:hypothetical protein D3C76_1198660 [compost metagenome]